MKRQLLKLVNNEFRSLQLNADLNHKSLFDLIDYCVSVNEQVEKRGPDQATLYIRGLLVFNYFINSFIWVNYGFDQFEKTNRPDFIIYLNVFDYYDRNQQLTSSYGPVDSGEIKRCIIDYLEEKNVLKFSMHELLDWVREYIEYIKQEEEEDLNDNEDFSFESDFEQRFPDLKIADGNGNGNGHHNPAQVTSFNKNYMPVPSSPPKPIPVGAKIIPVSTLPKRKAPTSNNPSSTPYPEKEQLEEYVIRPQREPTRKGYHPARSLARETVKEVVEKQTPPPIPNGYNNDATPVEYNRQRYPEATSRGHYDRQAPPLHYSKPPDQQRYDRERQDHLQHPQFTLSSHYANSHPHPHPQQPPLPPPHGQYQPKAIVYSRHPQAPPVMENGNHFNNHHRHPGYSVSPNICGLRNLGTTCYINSTIQLLFSITDFKKIFGGNHTKYVRKPQFQAQLDKRNYNQDVDLVEDAMASLLATFRNYGGQVISPTKFLRIVGRLKPDFDIPNEQQDAQEFLLFVLDRLHDELSDTTKLSESNYERVLREYVRQWDIAVGESDMKEYLKWYRQLLEHEGTSPIHDICQGQIQHRLVCGQCGFVSTSYSPFTILSLTIPNKQAVNLSECIQMFTSDEVLSGDNSWNCPKCCKQDNPLDTHPVFTPKKSGIFKLGRRSKSPNKEAKKLSAAMKNATSIKQLIFVKFPKVLFIHLSRFSMFSMTDKLDTAIDFPLVLQFSASIVYKLSGVINHYGNLKSGHYTATVNKSTAAASSLDSIDHPYWCNFDDSVFSENVPFGHNHSRTHNSRDVYVLCYERVEV